MVVSQQRRVSTGEVPGDSLREKDASESPHRPTLPDGHGRAGGGREEEGNALPQPPGFVLYAEAVLRWLGVEGVTPEVIRRAKRGLREQDVAAKMWRALLRVSLLHLDSLYTAQTPSKTTTGPIYGPVSGRVGRSTVEMAPDSRALLQHRRPFPVKAGSLRKREGVIGSFHEGLRKAGLHENVADAGRSDGGLMGVPLGVAAETCGFLLRRWGYRRSVFYAGVSEGDILQTREVLLALAWLMTKARVFHAYEKALSVNSNLGTTGGRSVMGSNDEREEQGGRTNDVFLSVQHPELSTQALNLAGEKCGVNCAGSPQGVKQPPPPFPRDPSETPENARIAANAFVDAVAASGAATQSGTSGGGRGSGRQEWHGAGKREPDGQDCLTRALRAARELMCCYGRLEAELRVVEGLEAARQKMLRRMHLLYTDLQAEPLSANTTMGSTCARPPWGTQGRLPPMTLPLNNTNPSTKRPKQPATTTPFCLCLSAKTKEEQLQAFAEVSRARAALELREEGKACRERWSKWLLSAIAEEAANRNSMGTVRVPDREGSAQIGGAEAVTGVSMRSRRDMSGVMADSLSKNDALLHMNGEESRGVTDAVSEATRKGAECRVRALQEALESKLRAFRRPKPPSRDILPGQMGGPETRGLVGRAGSQRAVATKTPAVDYADSRKTNATKAAALSGSRSHDDCASPVLSQSAELRPESALYPPSTVPPGGDVASDMPLALTAFCRAANEIESRVGGREMTRALERAVVGIASSRDGHLDSTIMSADREKHTLPHGDERKNKSERATSDSPMRIRDTLPCHVPVGRFCDGTGVGDLGPGVNDLARCCWDEKPKWRWAQPGELEKCRRLHRDRLEGLLSAYVGTMPIVPRGAGW